MGAVKGILKFGIYFFIGVWMFALGVIVGRGNSPVTFDTDSFQVRLAAIVHEFEKSAGQEEKVDLQFYDVLNNPVRHEVFNRRGKPDEAPGEIVPKKETDSPETAAPLADRAMKIKTGKKYATLKSKKSIPPEQVSKAVVKRQSGTSGGGTKIPKKVTSKKSIAKSVPTAAPATIKTAEKVVQEDSGRYTIQVAAYRDFKDAVTQMSTLETKGFDSYRTKGTKGGKTWYRVRIGSFGDYKAASAYFEKLKQADIKGMIIKKDE